MKKIVGILVCMLLIANVSVVLGNTDEIPRGNGAGIGPNLAPNPSFEEGDTMPTEWTYSLDTNGTYTWDSNYAYSGEKSIGILNLTNIYPPDLMWVTTDFIPVDCRVNSYIFSAWFKFVEIPLQYQYAVTHIHEYDINFHPTGSGGHGGGSDDTEWHQMSHYTGYSNNTKYVKLEIGLAYILGNEPDPLIEIRYDDVYFGICNTFPNTPTITGETNGRVRTLYEYSITTTDPDQDNVSYKIDWGDNTTQTTPVYRSGEEIIISHIWGIERTYNVKVKAIDEHHAESDWETLTVSMPKNKAINIPSFLQRFFQCFPFSEKILNQYY